MIDPLSLKAQHQFSCAEQHLQQGRHQAALSCFKQALKAAPGHPFILFRIGIANHLLGLRDEAIRWYRKALAVDSNLGEAHNNLGKALLEQRRFQEAADAFGEAGRLLPGSPVPLTSQASALLGMNRLDQAEQLCREALQRDPDYAEAHWNRALILLKQGHFTEGWHEYEWRWQYPAFPSPRRTFPYPAWDGTQPLEGKRILIHAEQGFGDTIQFVRFLPHLRRLRATVLFACQPELAALMAATFAPDSTILPFGAALPDADYHLPLLSLPRFLMPDNASLPRSYPYLLPPAERLRNWSALLDTATRTRKAGLVWAGKQQPDPARSIPVRQLAPLANVSDITWYSLQLPAGSKTASDQPDLPLTDLTAHINDFADTAALISHLDLVISIDTATVHLAGALGVPVWLLLPTPCDWRWMTDHSDSPWYPTMRLFRQERPREWQPVIAAVADQLNRQNRLDN